MNGLFQKDRKNSFVRTTNKAGKKKNPKTWKPSGVHFSHHSFFRSWIYGSSLFKNTSNECMVPGTRHIEKADCIYCVFTKPSLINCSENKCFLKPF